MTNIRKKTMENDQSLEVLVAYAIAVTRKEAGITQKVLSEKTGIAQGDISRLENGLSNPSLSTLRRIADAMGKKVEIRFVDAD